MNKYTIPNTKHMTPINALILLTGMTRKKKFEAGKSGWEKVEERGEGRGNIIITKFLLLVTINVLIVDRFF